jgi:hypothetical protein
MRSRASSGYTIPQVAQFTLHESWNELKKEARRLTRRELAELDNYFAQGRGRAELNCTGVASRGASMLCSQRNIFSTSSTGFAEDPIWVYQALIDVLAAFRTYDGHAM